MSEHAFSSVICRDDTSQVHRPSDRDVNWMFPVQVKEPYSNLDIWLLVGFHPAILSVQSTPVIPVGHTLKCSLGVKRPSHRNPM